MVFRARSDSSWEHRFASAVHSAFSGLNAFNSVLYTLNMIINVIGKVISLIGNRRDERASGRRLKHYILSTIFR
jgi:hypothetical protein